MRAYIKLLIIAQDMRLSYCESITCNEALSCCLLITYKYDRVECFNITIDSQFVFFHYYRIQDELTQ